MTSTQPTATTANQANGTNAHPAKPDLPINAETGINYFGAKAKRLQEEAKYRGYTSDAWATVNQWNRLNETVAKGEKGTLMINMKKKPDSTTEPKRSFLFNRCQLESYEGTGKTKRHY